MLHGAVIGRQCSIKSRAMVFEGVVVGDGTVIGEDAVVQANVKIWPDNIDNGAIVNHSLIWGAQGRKVLFSRYGVTGVVNVDLTPEFVARLGAAFGSVLPKGSRVTINHDPHRSSRMIHRGLHLRPALCWKPCARPAQRTHPVTRCIPAVGAAGGVHVRLSPYDPHVVDIRFLGANGLNLTREQERVVERTSSARITATRIWTISATLITYRTRARCRAKDGYLDALDSEAIREMRFKIVVDYAHTPAADILPDLLDTLRVEVLPLNAHVDAGRSVAVAGEVPRRARPARTFISRVLDNLSLGVRLDVGGERVHRG